MPSLVINLIAHTGLGTPALNTAWFWQENEIGHVRMDFRALRCQAIGLPNPFGARILRTHRIAERSSWRRDSLKKKTKVWWRDIVRNILAGFYARKFLQVGKPVEVVTQQRILRAITATHAILEKDERSISVSNATFLDSVVRQ